MKHKNIILVIITILLTSCLEEAKIIVQNKVHNAKLESVSFSGYTVASSLITGESSECKISEERKDFPKSDKIRFYMVANGNRVYLETKQIFNLDIDETITVVISDTTQVVNPYMY